MTVVQATAEVFMTAFRALPKKEQHSVLVRMAEDEDIREDLLDLALIEERRCESSRPFREYLAEKGK
jgi:hypothetical protein